MYVDVHNKVSSVLFQDELTSTTSSSTPSPTDDSDHKALPTPAYCQEDVKPDLSTVISVAATSVTTVTAVSTISSVSAVTSVGQTAKPVTDVFIKTEVKTEPVDYDLSPRDTAVTSDLVTHRNDAVSETDSVGGASQGQMAAKRAVRDELLPLQRSPPPPLKPSSPRMSPLPFICRNSPATSQRSSPVTLQRASPVSSQRASPVLGSRGSPGPMHRGSPGLMHRGSPVPMHRGSPTLMHRGSPVPRRRGSPLALHHGLPLLPTQLTGQPPKMGFAPLPGSMTLPGTVNPLPSQLLQGSLYPVLPPDAPLQRPLQGPSQGPPPLVSSASARSPQLLDIQCKQEQSETPPPLVPGLPLMRPCTPPTNTAVRPHSPNQMRPRSHSRSPVRDTDSPGSDTVELVRSPSPPARVIDEECYRSKNAM